MSTQKDNSTLRLKAQLRTKALRELAETPVVLETHGGFGRLFATCYGGIADGAVFEKLAYKTDILAKQRPTWSVYEGDCVDSLAQGAASHLAINFVDCDPYGGAWPALEAFFTSDRPWPDRLVLAVNDGLRRELKMKSGWRWSFLERYVQTYGNDGCYRRYLEICRAHVEFLAAGRAYLLTKWAAYHCGHGENMTHFAAVLDRQVLDRPRTDSEAQGDSQIGAAEAQGLDRKGTPKKAEKKPANRRNAPEQGLNRHGTNGRRK